MSVLRLVLLCCLLVHSLSAVELWPASLGERPQAELHIAHPNRIMEALEAFAGRADSKTVDLADRAARYLYGSTGLSGIDLQRPSRFFWRANGSVLAVIPLRDRAQFVEDFTSLPFARTDLVAIGEREGTRVYAYNGEDAIYEYRLLVRDMTAYFGGSVQECELLAAHAWPHATGREPTMWYRHRQPRPQWPSAWRMGAGRWLPDLITSSLHWLHADVTNLDITLKPDRDGRWRLSADWSVAPGSSSANWLAAQRDQASRLLPVVLQGAPTLLHWYGGIAWNGSAVALFDHVREQKRLPAWLPETVAGPLRALVGKIDAQQSFAGALSVQTGTSAISNWMLRAVQRHDDVDGLMLALHEVVRVLQAVDMGHGLRLTAAVPATQAGEQAGEQALASARLQRDDAELWQLLWTQGRRHLVQVMGHVEAATLRESALAMATAVAEMRPPQGDAVILQVEADASAACAAIGTHYGATVADAEPTRVLVTGTVGGESDLHAELLLHPRELGTAMRATGVDVLLGAWLR